MGDIVSIPFIEDDLRDLAPTEELWELPPDAPVGMSDELPGEDDVLVIFEGYFGKLPPVGWTMGLARAMVNVGRRRIYDEWKSGSKGSFAV
jgi:hypothetical protein